MPKPSLKRCAGWLRLVEVGNGASKMHGVPKFVWGLIFKGHNFLMVKSKLKKKIRQVGYISWVLVGGAIGGFNQQKVRVVVEVVFFFSEFWN